MALPRRNVLFRFSRQRFGVVATRLRCFFSIFYDSRRTGAIFIIFLLPFAECGLARTFYAMSKQQRSSAAEEMKPKQETETITVNSGGRESSRYRNCARTSSSLIRKNWKSFYFFPKRSEQSFQNIKGNVKLTISDISRLVFNFFAIV